MGVGGLSDARHKDRQEKVVVEGFRAHPPPQKSLAAAVVEADGQVAALVVGAKEGIGRVGAGTGGAGWGWCGVLGWVGRAWAGAVALEQEPRGVWPRPSPLECALCGPVWQRADLEWLVGGWARVVPGRDVEALWDCWDGSKCARASTDAGLHDLRRGLPALRKC